MFHFSPACKNSGLMPLSPPGIADEMLNLSTCKNQKTAKFYVWFTIRSTQNCRIGFCPAL